MKYSIVLFLFALLTATAVAQDPAVIWMRGGHIDQISAAQFSPDSRMLVTAGLDGYLRLWEPATGRLLQAIESPGSILSISFSKSGHLLATGSVDGTIRLRDMESFRVIRSYNGEAAVNGVAISPDGSFIASAHSSGEIKIWNLDSATLRRTMTGHTFSANAVAISPDGKWIASGSDDFTVIVWNAESGAAIRTIVPAQFPVTALAFSPDGERLAVSAKTSVDEIAMSDFAQTGTDLGHALTITSIAYSPSGRYIASASEDMDVPGFILGPTVRVTDRQKTRQGFSLKHKVAEGWGTATTFSPDGEYFAWCSSNGLVRMMAMAPEGSPAILLPEIRTISTHYGEVRAVAFSPADNRLASADGNGRINLWDARSGTLERTLEGHLLGVNGLGFTADGRSLASAGTDGTIRIWETSTGTLQNTLYTSPQWATSGVAFSPDGRRVVAGIGFGDSTLGIWDTSKLDPITTFTGHHGPITAVAYGGDDRVFSSSEDGTVRVWNTVTGREEMLLDSSSTPWNTLALSKDRRTLAAGNYDGRIRVWSVPSGDPLAVLDDSRVPVIALDLSSDGSLVVSTGDDRSIRVREVASRRELHRYDSYPARHGAIAIDADSGRIATGTSNATVILWKLFLRASADAIAGAKSRGSLLVAPNPFGEHLTLMLDLPRRGTVDAGIYNLRGERVATIADDELGQGRHLLHWDPVANGSPVAGGIYFYRITLDGSLLFSGSVVRR